MMAKQGPELAKLIEAIRAAVLERDALALSIADRMAEAESKLRAAHSDLDRFLAGGVPDPVAEPGEAVAPPDDEPADPATAEMRRKVAAGLVDEAPCESLAKHAPHMWEDEVASVFCPGVERAIKV